MKDNKAFTYDHVFGPETTQVLNEIFCTNPFV